jgi:hypothetical protein
MAGEAVDRDCSLNLAPFSFRLDVGSSRIDGAAIEDLDFESIEVRGNLLLLSDALFESSALVFRAMIGWPPSRLRGR